MPLLGGRRRVRGRAQGLRGEEARYRYGAMLKSLGQVERANVLFREIIKNAERSPRFYQDAQSEWIKAAKRDSPAG